MVRNAVLPKALEQFLLLSKPFAYWFDSNLTDVSFMYIGLLATNSLNLVF